MKKTLSKIYQYIIKKECAKDMASFVNIHSGRCFIIGNGPSLTVADLELIKDEITFASNRIYGIFPKTEWRPTYFVSQDFDVLKEIKDQLFEVSFQCKDMFLCGNVKRTFPDKLKHKKNVHFYYVNNTEKGKKEFDIDIYDGIHNGINVSYSMIELAIYMGFKEIYLIGIDHNYIAQKDHKGNYVIDGNSTANYFEGIAPLKYKASTVLNSVGVANNDAATEAFENAKKYSMENGITIINVTRGGKLEVFSRDVLENILSEI